MFALDAKTGKVNWRTNTSKVAPGGKGGFFSSPAIAFGRVFAARDDGTVFAFDEKTGKVDWSFPTGARSMAPRPSPRCPGTPPTVYIGSEDEHLLRARREDRQGALAATTSAARSPARRP